MPGLAGCSTRASCSSRYGLVVGRVEAAVLLLEVEQRARADRDDEEAGGRDRHAGEYSPARRLIAMSHALATRRRAPRARASASVAPISATAHASAPSSTLSGGAMRTTVSCVSFDRMPRASRRSTTRRARHARSVHLDADEQAAAAHLADQRARERAQVVHQPRARARGRAASGARRRARRARPSPPPRRADCRRTCCRGRPGGRPASRRRSRGTPRPAAGRRPAPCPGSRRRASRRRARSRAGSRCGRAPSAPRRTISSTP